MIRPTIPLALAVAALCGALRADVLHFKDGRELEGQIIEETGDFVRIRSDFGTLKIERDKIETIEYVQTPREQLEERRKALADDDVAGLFDLGIWAEEQSLRKEARALFEEVVALAPDHTFANEKLGRVEVEGVWMDPEEVDAFLAEKAERMRAKGYVLHEGEWREEEEVMRAQGYVRFGDAWLPRREAQTRQATADAITMLEWTPRATESDHFTIFSELEQEDLEYLHYDLEAVRRHFMAWTRPQGAERAKLDEYETVIWLVPDLATAQRMITSGFIDRYHPLESSKSKFFHSTNYAYFFPRPLIVLVTDGPHLDAVDDEGAAITGYLAHHLGHVLIRRLKHVGVPAGWVEAGLAAYYEGVTNYHTTLSLCEYPGTERDGPWVGGWESHRDFLLNLQTTRRLAEVQPWEWIMTQPIEALDSKAIGASWSIVRYMMAERRDELMAYIRTYGNREAPPAQLHAEAWQAAFAESLEDVERRWEHWALAQPADFPREELDR